MTRIQGCVRCVLALALAALGAAGAAPFLPAQEPGHVTEARFATPPPPANDAQVSLEFAVVEIEGLGWREELGPDLEVLSQDGPQTVWALDGRPFREVETLAEIQAFYADGSVKPSSRGKVVRRIERDPKVGDMDAILKRSTLLTKAPKVTTFDGNRARVENLTDTKYVSRLTRIQKGDGKAFRPEVASLTVGFRAEVRPVIRAEGVSLRVEASDTHLVAMHNAKVPFDPPGTPEETTINGTVQVPEVVRSAVQGDWLVPPEGTLVISLGVRTHQTTGLLGKPSVRERLMVIRPRPIVNTAVPQGR